MGPKITAKADTINVAKPKAKPAPAAKHEPNWFARLAGGIYGQHKASLQEDVSGRVSDAKYQRWSDEAGYPVANKLAQKYPSLFSK